MTTRTRRGGFTLIELITVIGILALMAAITAAGVSKVRATQMSKVTDQTVTKLQTALDQQWKAACDNAASFKALTASQQDTLINNCPKKDRELAAAALAYMITRREFPQTLKEAKDDVVGPGGVTLKARATFASLPSSAANAQEESAILLYAILAEQANQGMKFNPDDVAQGMDTNGTSRVFKDAWGMPIMFVRYASGGAGNELNAAPYINSSTGLSQDPLDPKGKLKANPSVLPTTNVFPSGGSAAWTASAFDGTNRQPAVISAGANKDWENSPYGGDNPVGYRLRREGNKGE